MPNPMQMYEFVHDAILREVASIEEAIRDLKWDGAAEIDDLDQRLSWFHDLVKVHEGTEEGVLFPKLEERFRFVSETYAFDHDDSDEHVFAGFSTAIEGLRNSGGGSARRDHFDALIRQSVVLHEHMRLHITKENELLLPKVASEFDLDEQIDIAGAMAGMVEPPVMLTLVEWMYRGQGVADRETMVRFLMNVLPEAPFGAVSGRLSAVDDAAWSQLVQRIPELSPSQG